jgi:RNA ligase (TIGR02306 family)
MARKLASIQVVNGIEPIPNADAIEKIRVLGWNIVVKKGEYRVGDPVVYCEIDSLLPERDAFEFLRASSYKSAQVDAAGNIALPAGFRIKTVRLRGQVSQGICFPLSILSTDRQFEIGEDVTDELGIVKWEPPVPPGMVGGAKGPFPGFLPKTDETRVQLLQEVLEQNRGKTFYVTEKLDGTSFSSFLWQGEFGVCSRNLWLDENDVNGQLVSVARSLKLEEKLRAARERLGFDIAIQGELIGPGIQKNKYALASVSLRVFNLLNLSESRLLDFDVMQREISNLELIAVPYLESMVLNHTVDELIQASEGKSLLNNNVEREGIVLRPLSERYDSTIGGRLSFKAINPKFLLKYDE